MTDQQEIAPGAFDEGPWTDAALGGQALRLQAAAQEGHLLAVTSSDVMPLPHQVQAVYHRMLPRERLRFLLADDPGAGKTIMTGLWVKELLAAQRATRVLIVAPGALVAQWVEELWTRFGLTLVQLGAEHLDATDPAGPSIESAGPLVVAPIGLLTGNMAVREGVLATGFDVVVVDEAHRMSAHHESGRVVPSSRYELGLELTARAEHLLLLTATPHNGKSGDFQLFLRLLGVEVDLTQPVLDQAPMRRLLKEQLVHADGRPLFPPRVATTLTYAMEGEERDLYEAVTAYVTEEMNKVPETPAQSHTGLAMMLLQRRLASSPAAILRSLQRRLELLQSQGLEGEAQAVERLVEAARRVRADGVDRKWDALRDLLTSPEITDQWGVRRKVIVFTEHQDTLDYLRERLGEILAPGECTSVISGQSSRQERRQAEQAFRTDPACSVMLATDAAGEGLNLQVANLMVNYDIPWNPNRLEQRFGRIHRIGQDRTCYLWNLVAADTREGDVFSTLLGKLQAQREALGDRVFDVLGDVLSGADLSQILIDAVCGVGGGPGMDHLVDCLDRCLPEEVEKRAASMVEFSPTDLAAIQGELAHADTIDLPAEAVQTFAREALRRYGADVRELSPATWCLPTVPARIAAMPGVQDSYARLHLDRACLAAEEAGTGHYLAPGHPLLTALTTVVLEDLPGLPTAAAED